MHRNGIVNICFKTLEREKIAFALTPSTHPLKNTGALGQRDRSLAVFSSTESLLMPPMEADLASEHLQRNTVRTEEVGQFMTIFAAADI